MSDTRTIQNLTVAELKELISVTVKQAIEDEIEDIQALASTNYIQSVKEARADYTAGKTKSLDELFPNA